MTPIKTIFTCCLSLINVSTSDNIAFVYYKDEYDTYEDACKGATNKIIKECSSGEYAVKDVTIYSEEVL